MNQENYISQQIKTHFGSTKLYEILQVSSTATSSEIKKAYMKLALKHHPDKGGDSSTFQALSMVHAILSDEEKRKIYDESGLIDNDNDDEMHSNEQNFEFWNQYFRNLFPKLTISAIEKFAKEYIGSEEEKIDIVKAYENTDGNCMKMMELIMFAEDGEEQRIIKTIDELMAQKRIHSTAKYEKNKVKLLAKFDKYINNVVKEELYQEAEAEAKHHHPTEEEQQQQKGGNKKRKAKKDEANDEEDLQELIRAKHSKKNAEKDLFAKIISKYSEADEEEAAGKKKSGGKKKQKGSQQPADDLEDPLPDDEEFLKFQQSLFAEKEGKKATDKKKSQKK